MTASATAPVEPDAFAPQTYLPRLVLGPEAEVMATRWVPVDGTVVIADITGFTPLSERLAALGKEGAELLTTIINHYFQRLLDSAVAFGGDNLKFGGDALLLLFTDEQHADRAVAAALAMQSENRRAGAIHVGTERTHLQMRISVHSDRFWSAIVGEEEVRLQHIIAGPGIAKLAVIDKLAAPGEVALSEATREALSDGAVTGLRDETIVARSVPHHHLASKSPGALLVPEEPLATVRRWAGIHGSEGEHRKVTVMFARLDGINELLARGERDKAFEGLSGFVSRLVRSVDQFGGYLASNDVDQSGIKFIVLFGAPVANEQAAANALRLALALKEAAKDGFASGLSLRIGLNSGFMFCGDVGASHRREYTVLGDAVNLSARLMARAEPAQVIVSDATAAEAGPAFRWQPLLPMAVKGKAMPVPVRLLAGEGRPATVGRRQLPFFGREAERRLFAAAIEEARGGHAQVVIVSGEPGSGKSRLVSEMIEPLGDSWTVLRADAQSFTASMPFAAWTPVLSELLGLREPIDVADRDARAAAAITQLDPSLLESAPLFNHLLSLSLPESDILRSLDPDSRRERLMSLFGQLLAASARKKPTVVVIEDLQWADASSREVLATTVAALGNAPILICATSRVAVDLPHEHTSLPLVELPTEAADALLSWALGTAILTRNARAEIAEKCRGNPLFLEEVARALVKGEQGLGANPIIPDRLQSLLMAGLDSLPPPARRIARFASVLGTVFDPEVLREMLTPDARAGLDFALRDLVASRTIYQDGEGTSRYRFRHSLQQEVAYESLLFARRRELHGRVTSILEARHVTDLNSVVETLAYHTNLAGDAEKSARYSTLAGDKARAVYAWESAIVSYNTALQALARVANSDGQLRSALLERIGDCFELAGRYRDSAETYVRALHAWTAHIQRGGTDLPTARDVLLVSFDRPARGSQLRLKIAVAFERNSQYDRSLRWLRAAQAVMPARRPDVRADIFCSWSVVAFRKGRFSEAVELALKALAAARITGQPAQIAYSHHVLANSYGETGRLRRSVFHREAALVIYEQLGDIPRLFAGHGNLGLSYQSLGDFGLALNHHLQCIKAAEQIGNEVAAAIGQNNLGEVLLAQGHVKHAGDRFGRTIEVFRRRGEPRVPAGLALVNLSRVALRLGDVAAAKAHLAEGVHMLGAVSRGLATEGLLQEAEIALEEGQLDAAAAASARAVDEATALGMLLVESRARLLESRIEKVRGNVHEATARARRSLAVARRLGAAYEMAQAYLALAELAPRVNPQKVSERGRKLAGSAVELFERIGATGDLERARELAAAG